MADLVIGERRRESRRVSKFLIGTDVPQVPGARVLDVLDVSAHGLRCRLAQPVRPGRAMPLRLPQRGSLVLVQARVVWCVVSRLGRHGVQYDAAWSIEQAWAPE